MQYRIRVRLVAPNGDEGHTDIPTDERTAVALMDAGCDRFFLYEPITDKKTHTIVETYNLSYVHALADQRSKAEAKVKHLRKIAAMQNLVLDVAETMLDEEANK